ncbi:probable E3 ubiquitin-protein ligase makorin-1 [Antennarius striatus]|uniref:probable E3 ubiquitin-protein ligase makorin-1 n=1 Tax=Antennarius striatus TaxID=241820 RepID=UPI0035B444D5
MHEFPWLIPTFPTSRYLHVLQTSDAPVADRSGSGSAAVASRTQRQEEREAFHQSESVTCGICLEKVYENTRDEDRVFAILSKCNHSFCLQCIRTWRNTKNLGPDVVKTCPMCRVRSAFYVPSKYWVEGRAKEEVIAAFKSKFRKKRCIHYWRLGCCPFEDDCLYRHEELSQERTDLDLVEKNREDKMFEFVFLMSLLVDEEQEEEDFSLYMRDF